MLVNVLQNHKLKINYQKRYNGKNVIMSKTLLWQKRYYVKNFIMAKTLLWHKRYYGKKYNIVLLFISLQVNMIC